MLMRLLARPSDQTTRSKLDFLLVSALFFFSGTGKKTKRRIASNEKIKSKEKKQDGVKKSLSVYNTTERINEAFNQASKQTSKRAVNH